MLQNRLVLDTFRLFGEEYKLESFSLGSFLQPSATYILQSDIYSRCGVQVGNNFLSGAGLNAFKLPWSNEKTIRNIKVPL